MTEGKERTRSNINSPIKILLYSLREQEFCPDLGFPENAISVPPLIESSLCRFRPSLWGVHTGFDEQGNLRPEIPYGPSRSPSEEEIYGEQIDIIRLMQRGNFGIRQNVLIVDPMLIYAQRDPETRFMKQWDRVIQSRIRGRVGHMVMFAYHPELLSVTHGKIVEKFDPNQWLFIPTIYEKLAEVYEMELTNASADEIRKHFRDLFRSGDSLIKALYRNAQWLRTPSPQENPALYYQAKQLQVSTEL